MACGPVTLCSIMLCCLKAGIPCKLSPEAWLKDLAGTKPLSVLAKKVYMCDCKICMAYVHRFDLFNIDWFSGTLSCRDSQSMLLILVGTTEGA